MRSNEIHLAPVCLLSQRLDSSLSQLLFWKDVSLAWRFPRTSELWQGPSISLRLTKQPGVDRHSGAVEKSLVSSSVRAAAICADARDVHLSSSQALWRPGTGHVHRRTVHEMHLENKVSSACWREQLPGSHRHFSTTNECRSQEQPFRHPTRCLLLQHSACNSSRRLGGQARLEMSLACVTSACLEGLIRTRSSLFNEPFHGVLLGRGEKKIKIPQAKQIFQ